jgi:hypothetical protein
MLAIYGVSLHGLGISGYGQSMAGEWKRTSDTIIKTRLKAKNKIEMAQNYGTLCNLKCSAFRVFKNLLTKLQHLQ